MSELNFIDEKEVSYMPTATKYGLIGTLISIGIGLGMYLMDMIDPANNTLSTIINTAIFLGVLVFSIKTYRDIDLNGFVSFGRAFGTGFMTTLIMSILGAIWTYVFFTFVAPDMMDLIMDITREQQTEAMVAQGASEDEIEQAIEMTASFMSPGFFTIVALFMSLLSGAVISLIVAAVMKKDHPARV